VTRRVAVAALSLVLGFSAVVVIAAPAHAAYSDCWTGNFCLFDGNDGSGQLLFSTSAPRGTCVNIPTNENDRANSYINRLGVRYAQVYRDANCTGHGLHKTNGFGGPSQPFPPAGDNRQGSFINVNNVVLPGCSNPDHCDRNIATSIWLNN
jgi:hypothetical protein